MSCSSVVLGDERQSKWTLERFLPIPPNRRAAGDVRRRTRLSADVRWSRRRRRLGLNSMTSASGLSFITEGFPRTLLFHVREFVADP